MSIHLNGSFVFFDLWCGVYVFLGWTAKCSRFVFRRCCCWMIRIYSMLQFFLPFIHYFDESFIHLKWNKKRIFYSLRKSHCKVFICYIFFSLFIKRIVYFNYIGNHTFTNINKWWLFFSYISLIIVFLSWTQTKLNKTKG